MPTWLGQEFATDWNGIPPHMISGDYRVWQSTRAHVLQNALKVFYDVGVGSGQPVPPGTEDNIAYAWTKSTQRRIDVLVEYQDHIKIIELRENAKEQELGRLEMYELLYLRDPVLAKPVKLMLISGFIDKDVEELARLKGIEYVIA